MSKIQEYHGYSRDHKTEGSVQLEYRNSRVPCSPECDRDSAVLVLVCVRGLYISSRVIWPQQCKQKMLFKAFFILMSLYLNWKDSNETRNGIFLFLGSFVSKGTIFISLSHSQDVTQPESCLLERV